MNEKELQLTLSLIDSIRDAYSRLVPDEAYWKASIYAETYSRIKDSILPKNFLTINYASLTHILEEANDMLTISKMLFKGAKTQRFFVISNYCYCDDDYPRFEDVLKYTLIPYSDELFKEWEKHHDDYKSIYSQMYPVSANESYAFDYFSSEADARLAVYCRECMSHYECINDI